jgi:hypothetical protein
MINNPCSAFRALQIEAEVTVNSPQLLLLVKTSSTNLNDVSLLYQ